MPLKPNTEITSKKAANRNLAKRVLAGLDADRRREVGSLVLDELKKMECWQDAGSLLIFLSFGSEISTNQVIGESIRAGKSVFVPVVGGRLLVFRRIMSTDAPMRKGVLGIREPGDDAPIWSPGKSPGPTLVLVPGLAFDRRGGRLGRGAGYYDRFIASVREGARKAGERPPLFIGFGCREQIVSDVPMENHDEYLDGLVTDDFSSVLRTL